MGRTGPRLADLLASLSLAMDLGLGLPMEWVHRCTLTGLALADEIEADDSVDADVYYLSLLRHLGCTSMAPEFAHSFGTDLVGAEMVVSDPYRLSEALAVVTSIGRGQPLPARATAVARAMRAPSIVTVDTTQCDAACRLAEGLGVGPHLVDGLRQTRERWDGKGSPGGVEGDGIALPVRIAHVAQDLVTATMVYGREEALNVVRQRAGRSLDPELVSHVEKVALPDEEDSTWDTILAMEPKPPIVVDDKERALAAFADFADLKSPHFLGHSRRVASLAAAGAQQLGLGSTEVEEIRLAGLVHDVGRVAISTSIWDKPTPLAETEFEKVRLHPYYTGRVLNRSGELGHLSDLACSHHERMDGTGYHRSLQGRSLPVAARILAAADFYSSLVESRAHRPALEPAEASKMLDQEARSGHLDDDAVRAVKSSEGHETSGSVGGVGGLTPREIEVLRLAARGNTVKEIADVLMISRKTADRHLQNVYTKLGISTRAAAAIWALEHGLL